MEEVFNYIKGSINAARWKSVPYLRYAVIEEETPAGSRWRYSIHLLNQKTGQEIWREEVCEGLELVPQIDFLKRQTRQKFIDKLLRYGLLFTQDLYDYDNKEESD